MRFINTRISLSWLITIVWLLIYKLRNLNVSIWGWFCVINSRLRILMQIIMLLMAILIMLNVIYWLRIVITLNCICTCATLLEIFNFLGTSSWLWVIMMGQFTFQVVFWSRGISHFCVIYRWVCTCHVTSR